MTSLQQFISRKIGCLLAPVAKWSCRIYMLNQADYNTQISSKTKGRECEYMF